MHNGRRSITVAHLEASGSGELKIVNILLLIHLNLHFGCSKKYHFEYPQHLFWLRNKKTNFELHTNL